MVDEALDIFTHDMVYNNYDEQLVTGADQVAQNIKTRLLWVKGEWFLDTTLGTIDFTVLATKASVKAMVDAAIKATIKDTPEVNTILSYSSTLDGKSRVLQVTFSADTRYGPVTSNTIRISV